MKIGRSSSGTEGNSASSVAEDLDQLSLEVESAVGVAPAWRSATQLMIASVVCVVSVVLFVAFTSQWAKSAALDALGRTRCDGPQCVAFSLERLDSGSGVIFPDGTTVTSSSESVSVLNDRSVNFEVRLPAGAPAPEVGKPWQSEPDPETGIPLQVRILMEQGLKDVRWTDNLWVTEVEEKGYTIVLGGYGLNYANMNDDLQVP